MRDPIRDYELKKGGRLWAAVVYHGKRIARNGELRDSRQWFNGFEAPGLSTILQEIYFRDRPDLTPQILSIYLEGAESLKKHFRRIEVSR